MVGAVWWPVQLEGVAAVTPAINNDGNVSITGDAHWGGLSGALIRARGELFVGGGGWVCPNGTKRASGAPRGF